MPNTNIREEAKDHRSAACDRLDTMITEGRVVRNKWTDGERACLLAALVPECGEKTSSDYCPAEVLPKWLANLTPSLDDNGTLEAWPSMVKEFARLVRASADMTPEKWERLDYRFRRICVADAAPNAAGYPEVMKAIDDVNALLEYKISGLDVTAEQWSAAYNTAYSAACSAAYNTAYSATRSAACSAAKSAARSAAHSAACSAAKSAARSAAWSAASAASAARSAADSAAWSAADSAASAASSATSSAAWDRLTAALFVVWQAEISAP